MFKLKKNILKYKNIKTYCKQNHRHDSKLEANYCNDLELLKRAGEILDYYVQQEHGLYAFSPDKQLGLLDKKVGIIKVDFAIKTLKGKWEIHEIKSKITKTALWKIKRKLFEVNYPDIKYIVIGDK